MKLSKKSGTKTCNFNLTTHDISNSACSQAMVNDIEISEYSFDAD